MAEKRAISTVEIHLQKGPITATVEDDLIVAQGIRYANQLRFAPPSDVKPWTKPIDCTRPGPVCPQVERPFEPLGDMIKVDRVEDEDCLRLNVVAPVGARKDSNEKLPVMVWIHGGAYVIGAADLALFDTRGLARRGMVIVSVQYRLGLFGYAHIPGVAPANLGLMDQIAALRWVQDNISAFGGDPNAVTVFGQSAGGDATYSILLAEGTENLYKQAIIISAPFGVFQNVKKHNLSNVILEKAAGRDLYSMDLEKLLKLQFDVLEHQRKHNGGSPGFIVEPGQAPLPAAATFQARLKDIASKKRVMVGWAKDDALPFVYMNPRAATISSIPLIGSLLLALIGRIATHFIFAKGAKAFHRQFIADGGQCHAFCVEYFPAGAKFRASHCIEAPFLFGGYEEWSKTPLLKGMDEKVYDVLSREVKNLFEAFAKQQPLAAGNVIVKEGYTYQKRASKL